LVGANKTNWQDFTFRIESLKVESDPPGATVAWPAGAAAVGELTHSNAPFTIQFRSGAIPFTASLPCYSNTLRTNYFYPSSEPGSTNLVIELDPKPVPLTRKPWTNSLNMVFRWVDSLGMWACEVETRFCDFHAFAEETHYEASAGVFSLDQDGWKQRGYSWKHPGPGFLTGDDYPIVGVNWTDATNFCDWLTKHERKLGRLETGQHYRLPKTNEWIALTDGPRFPWIDGDKIKGNFAGTEVVASNWPACWPCLTNHDDGFPRTAPVRSAAFESTKSGYYHLGGNAAEWCEEQVLCGGSWFDGESDDLAHLRTALIDAAPPFERRDRNGFRVFLEDITPPSAGGNGGL